VGEFARRRGVIAGPGVLLTLVGLLLAVPGLGLVAGDFSPEDLTSMFVVMVVPGGMALMAGLVLLARAMGRHRLRIDTDGIMAATTDPGPADRLRVLGPLIYGLAVVAAGLFLIDKEYSEYSYYTKQTITSGTAYHPLAVFFLMVGVVALVVGIVAARQATVRAQRWRRHAGPSFGGRAWAECRFPWADVDIVAVRPVGVRRAKTVLVGARSDSDLYRTPATAERFRPKLRAFAVCDLSASAMPIDEVTAALRTYGGDRWRTD
jgi:hypothetical protein